MSDAGEEQILRYATDLARLYAQAAEDRQRRERLEQSLVRITEAGLELARSLSVEDAGRRLAMTGVALGWRSAAVYLSRRDRLILVARDPADIGFPTIAPIKSKDLRALEAPIELTDSPWVELVASDVVSVLPLPGRRRLAGVLVGDGELPSLGSTDSSHRTPLLSLLARHAGVVLENHLLDERRGRSTSTQKRVQPTTDLLGDSPPMREVLQLVARLARVDSSILLTGETGTGKSLIARALHESGPRADKPFVSLNCGAIPENLVESELFGHEEGAFTGAVRRHRGKVAQADGGTLFLDEIGELPFAVQSKLLTFLEDRRFSPVGGEQERSVDVRVVSATNTDLEAAVAERRFRQDLLYRLNVFTIELPPLRDRGADVLELARRLAREVCSRYDLPEPVLDAAGEGRLLSYAWPGNVRELRNVVEKAVILSDGGCIPPELLPVGSSPAVIPTQGEPTSSGGLDAGLSFVDAKAQLIEQWETTTIRALLEATGGNIAHAARLASLDKKSLHKKIKQYGIDARAIRER